MQLSPFGCDWQSCVFAQMIPIHWPRVIIDKTSTSTVEMERCYALIRNVKYRHHTLHMRVNTNICCVASSSIPDDDTRKICTNSRWMQFNLDVVTVMSTNNGTNKSSGLTSSNVNIFFRVMWPIGVTYDNGNNGTWRYQLNDAQKYSLRRSHRISVMKRVEGVSLSGVDDWERQNGQSSIKVKRRIGQEIRKCLFECFLIETNWNWFQWDFGCYCPLCSVIYEPITGQETHINYGEF